MTKYQKNPNTKITPKIAEGLCDMYEHGVELSYLIEWSRLPKVTVMDFLRENYRTDIYDNLIRTRISNKTILPNITEPDLFACQLALLVNIGGSAVQDFFDKVRENYPTVTLAIENTPAKNDFYTTPDLELEIDIENDFLLTNGNYELYPLENSADYNRLG